MSEQTHTKEPWVVNKLTADGTYILKDGWEITTPNWDSVTQLIAPTPIRKESDAIRIVTCVNEFSGIPQDKVEGLLGKIKSKLIEMERIINRLEARVIHFRYKDSQPLKITTEWFDCYKETLALFPDQKETSETTDGK